MQVYYLSPVGGWSEFESSEELGELIFYSLTFDRSNEKWTYFGMGGASVWESQECDSSIVLFGDGSENISKLVLSRAEIDTFCSQEVGKLLAKLVEKYELKVQCENT